MKVLVLADLHFDFWGEEENLIPLGEILKTVDKLILAGDITNKPKKRWKIAFKWLINFIKAENIYIFPGNHDYYDHLLDGDDRLKLIAEEHGVNFVNRKSVILGNTRFLCATLWTDLELYHGFMMNKYPIENAMNDYKYIRINGYRRIRAEDIKAAHIKDLNWLRDKLDENFNGETIVVTHHVPHPDGLNPSKKDKIHDAAYASNLSCLLKAFSGKASHWLYGHSHNGSNIDLYGWKLRSVSLGYGMENPDIEKVKTFIYNINQKK